MGGQILTQYRGKLLKSRLVGKSEKFGLVRTSAITALPGPEVVPGIVAVAIRLYLVERKSAIGPIGHFDWDGP
jgi:hypothetical protein